MKSYPGDGMPFSGCGLPSREGSFPVWESYVTLAVFRLNPGWAEDRGTKRAGKDNAVTPVWPRGKATHRTNLTWGRSLIVRRQGAKDSLPPKAKTRRFSGSDGQCLPPQPQADPPETKNRGLPHGTIYGKDETKGNGNSIKAIPEPGSGDYDGILSDASDQPGRICCWCRFCKFGRQLQWMEYFRNPHADGWSDGNLYH